MNNDPLARDVQTQDDCQTRNYPPEGDRGHGAAPNTFSPLNQRPPNEVQETGPAPFNPEFGLIDQSLDGGPLSSELQDAQQGSDTRSREAFAHAAQRDFAALNSTLTPHGRNPDSGAGAETGERLASAYADARGRQFESGTAGGDGEDVGPF
ncbi:hypothetical protein LXA43DRAFT_1099048 [Ganoderma leucocontextum]|nr:hypothetical protein LXA43DRAFT_1099048 [Ganoderma leucocontextum]